MLVIIGQKTATFVGQSVTPAICPGFEAVRNLQYFNKLGLICRFSVCPGFPPRKIHKSAIVGQHKKLLSDFDAPKKHKRQISDLLNPLNSELRIYANFDVLLLYILSC